MDSIEDAATRKQLYDIHYELLGIIINQREMNYWISIIKHDSATIDDFTRKIITSDEYLNNISTIFKDEFYSMLGSDYQESVLENITKLFKTHAKKIISKEKKITIDNIKTFISDLEYFETKYKTFINKEYIKINGLPKSQNDTDYYFDMFKTDYYFDTTILINAIQEKAHLKIDSIADDTTVDHEVAQKNARESGNIIVEEKIVIYIESLESFYLLYKRQMFVEEYFYYIINKNNNFNNIYEEYKTFFNITKKIYLDYKNENVTEYDFASKFIYKQESNKSEEEFTSYIVDGIINTDKYELEMTDKIKSKYKFLYDQVIDDVADVSYYYYQIKDRKLSLKDEAIESIIVEYKKETETFSNNIYKVYEKTLERYPDVNEVKEHICKFRYSECDRDVLLSNIERSIIESLEFNEVLKKQIQCEYLNVKNEEILPSSLYNLLKIVRNEIDASQLDYDEIIKIINNKIVN